MPTVVHAHSMMLEAIVAMPCNSSDERLGLPDLAFATAIPQGRDCYRQRARIDQAAITPPSHDLQHS
jgi:hypothetical protein